MPTAPSATSCNCRYHKTMNTMSPEEQHLRRKLAGLSNSHTRLILKEHYSCLRPAENDKLKRVKREQKALRARLRKIEQEREAQGSFPSTQAVLDHHLAAFDSGDMDAVLSDYAAGAILLTPEGVFRGRKEIKPVLQRLLDNVFAHCTSFEMIRQTVEGDVAFIVWSAESPSCKVPLATDTYFIKAGKIVVQTFAGKIEARRK